MYTFASSIIHFCLFVKMSIYIPGENFRSGPGGPDIQVMVYNGMGDFMCEHPCEKVFCIQVNGVVFKNIPGPQLILFFVYFEVSVMQGIFIRINAYIDPYCLTHVQNELYLFHQSVNFIGKPVVRSLGRGTAG